MAKGTAGRTRTNGVDRGARLDRERIVAAAQRILDTEGLGALTMRRIGAELDVDPTAVYRHFRDKGELITELADRAFMSIPLPDPELSWQDQLRHQLRCALGLYRSNPEFAMRLVHQDPDTPGLKRVAEHTLRLLADAGLEPREGALAYQLLTNYAVGSGLFMGQLTLDDWGPEKLSALQRTYAALPPDAFPQCVAAAPFLFSDEDEGYELGVDALVDMIERLASSGATQPRRKPSKRTTTSKDRN